MESNNRYVPFEISEKSSDKYHFSKKYGLLSKSHTYRRIKPNIDEIAMYCEQFNIGRKMIPQYNDGKTSYCHTNWGRSTGAMTVKEFEFFEYVQIPYILFKISKFPYDLCNKLYDVKNRILDIYYDCKYPYDK